MERRIGKAEKFQHCSGRTSWMAQAMKCVRLGLAGCLVLSVLAGSEKQF